jgi:hypothetical protein
VKDRIVTPPASPSLVGPRAALWSKLVAAHDLGTNACSPVAGEGLVGAAASTRLAVHLVVRTGSKESVQEPGSGVSEWLFEGLPFAGAKAVKRNRKVVNTNQWHSRTPRKMRLRGPFLGSVGPAFAHDCHDLGQLSVESVKLLSFGGARDEGVSIAAGHYRTRTSL